MKYELVATDIREEIMTVARATVQAHGYNGLSFRELAKAVGVKSASVHYRFPSKGDLGAALAHRYTQDVSDLFENLLTSASGVGEMIDAYAAVFHAALLNNNRMCLCGIMSAEYDDLPPAVRVEAEKFADVNIAWLEEVLARVPSPGSEPIIKRKALAIFAAVTGAQLIARGRGNVDVFDQILDAYREVGLLP